MPVTRTLEELRDYLVHLNHTIRVFERLAVIRDDHRPAKSRAKLAKRERSGHNGPSKTET